MNDSTKIARAKSTFDTTIQKIADFNHAKKNFIKLHVYMYELKKSKQHQILLQLLVSAFML